MQTTVTKKVFKALKENVRFNYNHENIFTSTGVAPVVANQLCEPTRVPENASLPFKLYSIMYALLL